MEQNAKPKMVGLIKKFDQKLCNKYDLPARNIVKKQLGEENIIDNPDIYAEDMIICNPECKYKYLELQVCVAWKEDKFPYSNPFVYERKAHFSSDTLFLIFNKWMTKGLIFSRNALYKKPRRLKKYSRNFVYEVPWNKVLPICLCSLDMDVLNIY